jgi:predicted transposase/invertase (TIGR01784 family)
MPRFTKRENELESHFDKWLYFLKYLESFEDIPEILKEEVFIKGFGIAEIANFDERQLAEYEESLKVYRDLKAVVDTSIEEGFEEGFEEGKIDVAKKMKTKGYPLEEIIDLTGLAKEVIEKL